MTDALRGETIWVDRWRSSSAFGLPLEARGLYRELLSLAWISGGKLPTMDLRTLRRMVGAEQDEWDRSWPLVSHYWDADGVNRVQAEVYAAAVARVERLASASAKANRARWTPTGLRPDSDRRSERTPTGHPTGLRPDSDRTSDRTPTGHPIGLPSGTGTGTGTGTDTDTYRIPSGMLVDGAASSTATVATDGADAPTVHPDPETETDSAAVGTRSTELHDQPCVGPTTAATKITPQRRAQTIAARAPCDAVAGTEPCADRTSELEICLPSLGEKDQLEPSGEIHTRKGEIDRGVWGERKRGEPASAADAVLAAWRTACPTLQQPKRLPGLLKVIETALKRDPLPDWEARFARVAASPFLRGDTTDWRATLAWVLKPANAAKIDAGNYDQRQQHGRGSSAGMALLQRYGGADTIAPEGILSHG